MSKYFTSTGFFERLKVAVRPVLTDEGFSVASKLCQIRFFFHVVGIVPESALGG